MTKNIDISDPGFRERFLFLRDQANLTQAELALKAGVSSRTVHNVETGVRGVAQEKTLRLLAAALDVTYEHLVHGPPQPEPPPPPVPTANPPRRRRLSTAVLATAVVIAVLAGGFAVNEWRASPRVSDDAIAVMVTCFENTIDPDDAENLERIVRDLVISGLAESRHVRVLSCPDISHPDPEMHHALELQAVTDAGMTWGLFGSILQEESRLVLVSRLENAIDGTVLATQKVTAAADETIFDVAAQLAAQVKISLVRTGEGGTEKGLPIRRVTTGSVKAYRHYAEGMGYLKKLYREEARTSLRRAVAEDSTFAMAMVMLVHPELAGPLEERDSLLTTARRYADELTGHERYYLDVFSAHSGYDNSAAIELCEAMVKDYPLESEGYRLLARFYNNRREYSKALAALETAVEIDPFDGMSFNQLAYKYTDLGEYERAMDCLGRYIRLAPSEANPYDSRGDLLKWTGRPEEAIASYKTALDRNPRFFTSMENLGYVFTLLGRYDEAERYLRMMLSAEDSEIRSLGRWYLGMMEVYRGRLDRAETALRNALAADELEGDRSRANARKLCAIASVQAAQGEKQAAIATYEAARDTLQRYTNRAAAEWTVGYVCLVSEADLDEARAARDEFAGRLQAVGEERNHALDACDGWIQLRSGDIDAACASFEAAIAHRDMFHYRYPLSLAYLEAGRTDDAIRMLEGSMNRYSSDRVLHAVWGVKMYYHLGRAYELAGRHDDARAMYARFLDTWNGADPAFDEIGDAHQRIAVLDQNM